MIFMPRLRVFRVPPYLLGNANMEVAGFTRTGCFRVCKLAASDPPSFILVLETLFSLEKNSLGRFVMFTFSFPAKKGGAKNVFDWTLGV